MHAIHLVYKLMRGKDLENCTSDTPLEVCQARDETTYAMKITPKFNRRKDTIWTEKMQQSNHFIRRVAF
jgi:hypothetical protein